MSHHGLLRNLCSGTWKTSSLSFFFDLGVCMAVSLIFFSLLSLTAVAQWLLHFLKYVITNVLPMSLMSSALASSGPDLGPDGISSVQHGGAAPGVYSQKPPLGPHPQLPKPLNIKNNTWSHLPLHFTPIWIQKGFQIWRISFLSTNK